MIKSDEIFFTNAVYIVSIFISKILFLLSHNCEVPY
jgi:hypothetical protein